MSNEQDSEMMLRRETGEEKLYRQVLDDHLAPLTRYVMRMTNSIQDTEDIVQDTLIKFWQHKDQFDPERAKLTTWLHRIAHNLCIDHFRAQKPAGTAIEEPVQQGPDKDHLEDIQAALLASALMQLSEQQRSAIVMCHYQGIKQKDVAMILGISVDALESALRRGRNKLKTILDNVGRSDEQ